MLTEELLALLPNLKLCSEFVKGEAFGNSVALLSLEREEVTELCRRVAHLAEFIELHNQRPQRVAEGTIERCNYACTFRFAPLREAMLPRSTPSIQVVYVDTQTEHSFQGVKRILSERELLVARFLQDGCTRTEIASKLRIGSATVHTYCKRIFKKLNIKRAAELQRVSLDPRQDFFSPRSARVTARKATLK